MEFTRFQYSSPEQVFIVVVNNESTTISVGRAVCWDCTTVDNESDGVGVRLPAAGGTTYHNPFLFAGVVAGTDIASSALGRIQVYGPMDGIVMTGSTAGICVGAAAAWNQSTLSSLILRPFNLMYTTNYTGMLAPVAAMTSTTVSEWLMQGGCVVPISPQYTTYNTTSGWVTGTIATNASGWCKGFIRCL